MPTKAIDQLVQDALHNEPKTIDDEAYFISYVWASEDHPIGTHEFNKRQQNLYRYLIKHASTESLLRIRRKQLEHNALLKAKAVEPKAEKALSKGVSAVNPEYWQDNPDKPVDHQQVSMFIKDMKENIERKSK